MTIHSINPCFQSDDFRTFKISFSLGSAHYLKINATKYFSTIQVEECFTDLEGRPYPCPEEIKAHVEKIVSLL